MTTREKLIEELKTICHNLILYPSTLDTIADFIEKDRKRIVEPLVKELKKKYGTCQESEIMVRGVVRETIKRAGVE